MKGATITVLKKELQELPSEELLVICLRLAKFKKENKELLTYLLFEAHNEDFYIEGVKAEIDLQFEEINTFSFYYIKKSVRKILSNLKKQIRYSQQKETEAALLLHFCDKLKSMKPSIKQNVVLTNTFNTQIGIIKKRIATLEEDLQYDYNLELEKLL